MKNLSAALSLLILLLFPQITYAYCAEVGRTCIEPGGTRVVNGEVVTRDCFGYQVEYQCEAAGGQEDSVCGDLRNQGCTEQEVTCGETDENGRCLYYDKTYQCSTASTVEQNDCRASMFCQDGKCFDTSYDPNGDMGLAVAYLETARQVATYMEDGKLFGGDPHTCREGYGGIRKCCHKKTRGEAFSLTNQMVTAVAFSAAAFAAQSAWNSTIPLATAYVSDTIVGGMIPGMGALANATAVSAAATPVTFSFAGFSMLPNASYAQAASSGWFSGSNIVLSSNTGTGTYFVFNPVMFAIFAAFLIYQSLSSCKESEEKLALYRGGGNCQEVPSAGYCDKKSIVGCLQRKKAFCCYNSILAKTLNHTAKRQLGIRASYGKGKPNCDPITIDNLAKIDFSKVDFSEFIASIEPGGKGSAFWDSKMAEVEARRQQSEFICNQKPTLEERQACKNSISYSEGSGYTSFTAINTDSPSDADDYYLKRTEIRINASATTGRADVVEAPAGTTNLGYDKKIYDKGEDNLGSEEIAK